ncbi:ABC transporter substrate-binding protein [Subtercola sp. YIM 133946]|uniref:ABC transporter substrate-binding protein n=1 Tax=Subtercola sp. YIM 133946 TaxID=3118909 RepID=UPI002F9443E8
MSAPLENMDPARDNAPQYQTLRVLTNEPLLYVNPDGTYAPGLATDWGYVGTGNKTFEFTLRQGVEFSDGTPLTADAVKKWLLYYASQNGGDVEVMGGGSAGPFASIDTDGDLKVTLNLNAPNPVVPYVLSDQTTWGMVSSPACVDAPDRLATETCGVGPYVLDKSGTVSGSQWTLIPNDNYYDKSKEIWSSVVAKFIASPTARLQAMQSGQIDVMFGDASTNDAAKSAGIQLLPTTGPEYGYSLDVLGAIDKPLADVRVRQALNYAIDRKTIMSTVMTGKPVDTLLSSDGSIPNQPDYYPYDPDKAKALLAEAGYANGFSVTLNTAAFFGAGGTPLASAVAQYLGNVGVTVNVNSFSAPGEWQQSYSTDPVGVQVAGFDGSRSMWLTLGGFLPGGTYNQAGGGWTDSTLQQMYDTGSSAAETDQPQYWQGITARMAEQAYYLPVGQDLNYCYTTDSVKNVVVNGTLLPANQWQPAS